MATILKKVLLDPPGGHGSSYEKRRTTSAQSSPRGYQAHSVIYVGDLPDDTGDPASKMTAAVNAAAAEASPFPNMVARRVKFRRAVGEDRALVDVVYGTLPVRVGGTRDDEPLVKMAAREIEIKVFLGSDGAILRPTTTGPNSTLLTQSIGGRVITAQEKYAVWDISVAYSSTIDPTNGFADYAFTHNAGPWEGKAAKTVHFAGPSNVAGYEDDGGITYYTYLTYRFRPGGWYHYVEVLNDDGKPACTAVLTYPTAKAYTPIAQL